MNIHDKDFDRINQELIDRYVDRLKNKDHLLDDNYLSFFKIGCRASSCPEWYGRDKYSTIYRRDVLFYSKNDVKMTKIKRMNLLNFNIIDMKFEKMIIEHVSIMNGMFKNTEFLFHVSCLFGRYIPACFGNHKLQ